MITIAGGIVLGVLALGLIQAILTSPEARAALAAIFWVVVSLGIMGALIAAVVLSSSHR